MRRGETHLFSSFQIMCFILGISRNLTPDLQDFLAHSSISRSNRRVSTYMQVCVDTSFSKLRRNLRSMGKEVESCRCRRARHSQSPFINAVRATCIMMLVCSYGQGYVRAKNQHMVALISIRLLYTLSISHAAMPLLQALRLPQRIDTVRIDRCGPYSVTGGPQS